MLLTMHNVHSLALPACRPMLSTVIHMICSGQPKQRLEDISHAVVVEKEGAPSIAKCPPPTWRNENRSPCDAFLARGAAGFATAPAFAYASATECCSPQTPRPASTVPSKKCCPSSLRTRRSRDCLPGALFVGVRVQRVSNATGVCA